MDSLSTQAAVGVALDALSLRQQTLATNLANVNTEGYRARGVDFEQALRDALHGTSEEPGAALEQLSHLQESLRSGAFTHPAQSAGVDLDIELAQMSETVLRYRALIE